MSIEERMISLLCRSPMTTHHRTFVAEQVKMQVDWGRLLGIAASWQVEPIVLSNLRMFFSASMPADVSSRVSEKERVARAMALATSLLSLEIVNELRAASIDAIVLKGPAVALLAFGDASLRESGDVDLLLRPEDLELASTLLVERGYLPTHSAGAERFLIDGGHALEFSRGTQKVELHTRLFPRHLRLEFDLDELWAQSSVVALGTGTIRVLSSYGLLVFLCAHAAKHKWSNIRWAADIANLGGRMTSSEIQRASALASKLKVRRILSLGLRMAAAHFSADLESLPVGVLVSDPETRKLMIDAPSAASLTNSSRDSHRLPSFDTNLALLTYWIRCRDDTSTRLECVASVIFMPTGKDRGPTIIQYLGRPVRLAYTAARRVLA